MSPARVLLILLVAVCRPALAQSVTAQSVEAQPATAQAEAAPTVAAQPASTQPPAKFAPATVDFERHVAGLLSRLGCNSAACHGSFQGKGGFRLSLFGQSPELDYKALQGGRIDTDSPDQSLLLLKPSGREKHGGGIRMGEDSWEYELVRRWIAGGAKRTVGRGTVERLEIEPSDAPPLAVGQSVAVRVRAHFADGDEEDVTRLAEFRSRDESVALIDASGQAIARGAGQATIVVAYRGAFASTSLVVPYAAGPLPEPQQRGGNWIDEELDANLTLLGLTKSPPAADEEFLRRATLDVLGILPAPEEVRRFVADVDPHKRTKAIDALLAHPRRDALWATKMCDITACNVAAMESPEEARPKRAKMWHDWFRRRFADNRPYDEIVRGVLLATSRDDQPIETWIDQEVALQQAAVQGFESNYAERPTLDLFWRRTGEGGQAAVEDMAELTAAAFLGLRLHCARCHQHPYDRWSQADFAGYANVFARIEFGSSTDLRTAMNQRLESRRLARQQGQTPPELPRVQEVFVGQRMRPLTDAAAAALPKAPGGPVLPDDEDPRHALFGWMRKPDNPYFARCFVNRVWAKYFGAGLVEPVDDFSPANPPRHPRLLDRLVEEFVTSGYDIAHLERLILSSQAYQRSAAPTGNNAADQHRLARAPVRPLLAETLVDSLNAALEATDDFGADVPAGSQAIELAPNRFADPQVNELFRVLGRGDRKSLCDCDRLTGPTLRQPLLLMSDPRVLAKIRGGRLARLLREQKPDEQIVEEFYLATLSRWPEADEREFMLDHVAASEDRAEGLFDIVWALVNSREFLTNH
jgi:hypothetical protein